MTTIEDEMKEGCIGSLSELYDGNPPFVGRGAFRQRFHDSGDTMLTDKPQA